MKISEKDVAYVAELANLDLTAEERAQFGAQLDAILGYVEQLNELDTTGVESMSQVSTLQQTSLREDEVRPSLPQDTAVGSAPENSAGYFKVPKVIER
jgi:aspartyl-tRNA(Asn)/glutamyl-tRNA(Gln) amidotransferase subunit C